MALFLSCTKLFPLEASQGFGAALSDLRQLAAPIRM